MRIFYIRHLRVSRAWHDMTHCGQAKFLLAVTSGGQHGGAKPPDLDVLLVQGDLHRHSTFFRSFHIISQRFSTSEREVLSTVAHIDKTSCVCWAAAALDFASYRNSSSDKHLEFGGLLIWLGSKVRILSEKSAEMMMSVGKLKWDMICLDFITT